MVTVLCLPFVQKAEEKTLQTYDYYNNNTQYISLVYEEMHF